MAESAVGRAALVLTTDASGAKAGLAKFGNDAKAWADKTGTQLSGQLKSAFLAGGVAGLVGGSLSGGVSENVDAIKSWAWGMDAVKIAVESTRDSLQQSAYWMQRNATLADQWRAAMKPPEKAESLTTEIARIKADGEELARRLRDAKGEVNRLENAPDWIKVGGAVGLIPLSDAIKNAQQAEKDLSEAIAKNNNLLNDRLDQLQKLKQPGLDPTKQAAYAKLFEDLQKQIDALDMRPVDAFVADIGTALPGDKLLKLREMFEHLEKGKEIQAVNKDFDALLQSLKDAERFAGKTADQIARIQLAERGLDSTRLFMLDQAIARKERFETILGAASALADGAKKPLGQIRFDNAALAKGSAAEVSARVRHEFGGVPQQQLAEQRKGNTLLTGILEAAKSINLGTAETQFVPI